MLMIPGTGFLRQALHTILPVDCHHCGQALWDDPVPFFCQYCWKQITPCTLPTCSRCDRPFQSPIALLHSPLHQCSSCRIHPPAYTKAWTPYGYESPLKEAICQFKYHGKIGLTRPLASLLIEALGDSLPNIDCIVPVPLHPNRLREREYNQSLLLADQLGRHWNIPVRPELLVRIRPSVLQATLKRRARLKNLRRTFGVTQASKVAGKSVLVVDDVFTTGTTVNECAKVLRKAGTGNVYVGTLARMS